MTFRGCGVSLCNANFSDTRMQSAPFGGGVCVGDDSFFGFVL